jgi:aminoglycoside phosphotransferase (APT) family kinase protein
VSARGVGPVLDAAAAAAVALHAVPALAGLPRIGALDLLAHLEGTTLGRLCATLPRLAPRMDRLAVALRDAPPRAGREVMLHGDFHPANLMFTEAGPVFVDLDNLSVGPPERDLAIFAGRMALFAIRDGDGDRAVREALTLPERYRMAGGGRLDDRAFAWFVAASVLVRQLSNGVRRLAPGLPVIAERLLDLADEVLAAAR